MNQWQRAAQPVREPRRSPSGYLVARGAVGLLVIILVASHGYWQQGGVPLSEVLALLGWLASSSAFGAIGGCTGLGRRAVFGGLLFGDSLAAALAVRATGGIAGPGVLLFALPVLASGLVLRRPHALLLGGLTALLYAALGFEELQAGANPGVFWSAIIFHVLLFSAFGLASSLVGVRIANSLREAARTRNELEVTRLSTERILDNVSCGLLVVDPVGGIRTINSEAGKLGREDAQADVWRLLGEENRALLGLIEGHLRGDLERCDREVNLCTCAGSCFPAWVKISAVTDPNQRFHGLVVLFWDLSERKQLEQRARRRERLAAVGELSAGLAHEIRNSLKPITGCIELLLSQGRLSAEAAPMADVITREAAALEVFLSQFLALTRDKRVKPEIIDLEQLSREEARSLLIGGRWSSRQIRISTREGVRLWGDRDWLRQVLRNLMLNGLEAAPRGSVEVDFERFARGGTPWVRVRIRDEGPGLTELDEQEAFQPFRTTKPQGTGLGLSIVQRAVHEHGGRVRFDSAHSGGGCVIVELPAAQGGALSPVVLTA